MRSCWSFKMSGLSVLGSQPNLLIIGGSTRAAAFSAIRAGLTPLCLDCYADVDLQANATVRRIDDYPSGLIAELAGLPKLPLIYVGGMENHLDVLRVASEQHELLGNSVETVLQARNPVALAEALRLAQVEMPTWRSAADPPPADGSWLLRPLLGSGGRGIQTWDSKAAESTVLQEPHGFQQRIAGTSFSSVYIAPVEVGDIRFVGVTQQLIGTGGATVSEFQWCGNIGPITLSIPVEHKLRRVGNILKWKLGLRGLFGIDFLLTEEEQIYITEVNPRYPASLELLEFAIGNSLLGHHVRCFLPEFEMSQGWASSAEGPFFAKSVYYAPRPFEMQMAFSSEQTAAMQFPRLADLPERGTDFETGDPVCTMFAKGSTLQSCQEALAERQSELESQLFPR